MVPARSSQVAKGVENSPTRGQYADGRLDLEAAPSITDLSPNLAPLHPHDAVTPSPLVDLDERQ